jgi:hypothetical protein
MIRSSEHRKPRYRSERFARGPRTTSSLFLRAGLELDERFDRAAERDG